MTLASTGPSGFHLKPLVGVFAAAVFAVAAFAVGVWVGNERQPASVDAVAPVEAVAPVATPEVAPSANFEAYEAGKLDDGLLPSLSLTRVEPNTPSANFDAYTTGKLDPELAAANPNRYAASGAGHTSGNWAAYEAGKLDDGPALQTVTVDRSTGNWAAYEAGKLDDTPLESRSAARPAAVTGGHQEY